MIRPLRNDDYRGVVSLLRTVRADSIYTAAGMRHLIDSMPERAANAAWVADEGDGEIVGWSWAHRRWWRANDTAYAWVGVHPAARRRGLGGALWTKAPGRRATTADAGSRRWRSSRRSAGPSSTKSRRSSRTTASRTSACSRSTSGSASGR